MFLCIGFILFVKINYIVGLCIKLYIFVFVFSDYFKILLLLDVFYEDIVFYRLWKNVFMVLYLMMVIVVWIFLGYVFGEELML